MDIHIYIICINYIYIYGRASGGMYCGWMGWNGGGVNGVNEIHQPTVWNQCSRNFQELPGSCVEELEES